MEGILRVLSKIMTSEFVHSSNSKSSRDHKRRESLFVYDSKDKILRFIKARGRYRVNNKEGKLIKKGVISETRYALDLSRLKIGEYLVELEARGIIFKKRVRVT